MGKPMTDEAIKAYAQQLALEDIFAQRDRDQIDEELTGEYTDEELLQLLQNDADVYFLLFDRYENYTCKALIDEINALSWNYARLMTIGRDGIDEYGPKESEVAND